MPMWKVHVERMVRLGLFILRLIHIVIINNANCQLAFKIIFSIQLVLVFNFVLSGVKILLATIYIEVNLIASSPCTSSILSKTYRHSIFPMFQVPILILAVR